MMKQEQNERIVREVLVQYYLVTLDFCLNQKAIDELNDRFNQQFSGFSLGKGDQFNIEKLLDEFGSFGSRVGQFKPRKSGKD